MVTTASRGPNMSAPVDLSLSLCSLCRNLIFYAPPLSPFRQQRHILKSHFVRYLTSISTSWHTITFYIRHINPAAAGIKSGLPRLLDDDATLVALAAAAMQYSPVKSKIQPSLHLSDVILLYTSLSCDDDDNARRYLSIIGIGPKSRYTSRSAQLS